MERVIFNLLNNAAVYTPESSVIVVTARAGREVKSSGSVIETVSDELVLTVEDNGRGFPVEEVKNVFEKFYRLKNSRTGGTGLGLSIVKGFVEAHQGTVRLENLPGSGAKFTIVIPAEVSEISDLKNE